MTDAEETSADKAARAPEGGARRLSPLAFGLGALVTLCCGGGLALALGADSIASARARSELSAHGLECPDLALDVSYDLARAEVAPVRCTRTGTSDEVEAIELVDPAFVDLVLFSPTHLRAGRVRVHLRADDPGSGVDLGSLGPIAGILRIPSRIASATRAVAELARHELPPSEISSIEIVRGESVRVTATDATTTGGASLSYTVARIDLPALDGPFGTSASVGINAVTGDATSSSCTVRGELQIDASVPLVGEIHRREATTITATALDGPNPTWDVSFGS